MFLFYGLASLALSVPVKITSVIDLLKFSPEIALAFMLLWIFRRFREKEFAEQIVTVVSGKVIWALRTRWWTRRRELSRVQGVSASAAWDGFGRVILKAGGREYAVFRWILSEEATQLARELQQAVKR